MNFKKFKGVKLTYFIIALIMGITMMLLSNSFDTREEPKKENTERKLNADTNSVEKDIAEIVEEIAGVSDVSVFVTYDNTGVKKILTTSEENISNEEGKNVRTSKTQPVTYRESGDEKPFVNEEKLPEIRGIIICAKGVDDSYTNVLVTDAVASVMGVSVHRVRVLPKD